MIIVKFGIQSDHILNTSKKLRLLRRNVRKQPKIIIIIIIIIIGIQPLGQFGQRPELSQATGMALVRCILGKFLGVVCHCFPPRLDVRLYAS